MQVAPYGTWSSPLAAADLARAAISLAYAQVADGRPCWVENRPAEGGRQLIAALAPGGRFEELTPPEFNVRSRVHEYGGRPFVVGRSGILYFCNFADQRLYRGHASAPPAAITPEGYRYADFDLDPLGEHLYCVREDHTGAGEPGNALVALAHDGGAGTVLFERSDFVAYPRVSPDGRRLAWIAWSHPDMPWDATRLYVGRIQDGSLSDIERVAGGPSESVVEPRWDRDGTLYFVSDRGGWWNLHRWRGGAAEPVMAMEAELSGALWTLGMSSYALMGDGRAVFRYTRAAQDRLGVVGLASGGWSELPLPYNRLSSLERLSADSVIAVAASPQAEAALVAIDASSGGHRVLRAPGELRLPRKLVSIAEPLEFPAGPNRVAHAFYYPPRNPRFAAPSGSKPPLIVKVHGGPTSHSTSDFSTAVQFWTTRGFALLDVNHGGSTGFGREYREQLKANWGVLDVGDVVCAVEFLVRRGDVDPAKVAIRGGSAGGFTVLAALAFHDVFKAGASYYGVSDLEALARDTHKFESRYLERLVAPLPEGRAVYEARAPIRHLDGFRAPLIVFQGADDQVVPPAQSRAIVAALAQRGIPVEYLEFPGEQHGFRKAENIVRSLEAELAFYRKTFGL